MYQGSDGGVDTTQSIIFPGASYKLVTCWACKIPELKLNYYDQASMFELPPIPIAFTLRALHIYSLVYLEPQRLAYLLAVRNDRVPTVDRRPELCLRSPDRVRNGRATRWDSKYCQRIVQAGENGLSEFSEAEVTKFRRKHLG